MDEDANEMGLILAKAHVEWFLSALRPLLIDHMAHGFKHGVEYQQTKGHDDAKEKPETKTSHYQDMLAGARPKDEEKGSW